MSAATRTPRSPRPTLASTSRRSQPLPARKQVTPLPPRSQNRTASRVSVFPQTTGLPSSLQRLIRMRQISLVLALGLAGGAIVTYGWTVYSQQLWGSAMARLEKLRSNERELTANAELMKNELAHDANPKAYGLVPQSPQHFIFVKPAPPRPPVAPSKSSEESSNRPIAPLGY